MSPPSCKVGLRAACPVPVLCSLGQPFIPIFNSRISPRLHAAVQLGNEAAALLPLPSGDPRLTREPEVRIEAARRAAQPPPSQAAQDAQAAATLAYLAISYASLPGMARPLNHPLFHGGGEARVDALLGGVDAALSGASMTWEAPEGRSARRLRQQQLRRMQAEGECARLLPDGALVVERKALEMLLLPADGPPLCDLHTTARALLLASTLGLNRERKSSARILRRLAPLLDDPAALAQLGEQLAAAQARRGAAGPRLPSAPELHQLWLRMCERAGGGLSDEEGWPGIEEWSAAAARRLAQLESGNPRAAHDLAKSLAYLMSRVPCALVNGQFPAAYRRQYRPVTRAHQQYLDAARAAGNCYHTAYAAYNLAVDAARGCALGYTPVQAAALLREAEAAWAAVKKRLPQEWVEQLRQQRAPALAFRPVLQTHLDESPQARRCGFAGGAWRLVSEASWPDLPAPPVAPQAWSIAIHNRLSRVFVTKFDAAESRRTSDAPMSPKCDGCGNTVLATRLCSACGKARYCRWVGGWWMGGAGVGLAGSPLARHQRVASPAACSLLCASLTMLSPVCPSPCTHAAESASAPIGRCTSRPARPRRRRAPAAACCDGRCGGGAGSDAA